jgi:hypothetical protein
MELMVLIQRLRAASGSADGWAEKEKLSLYLLVCEITVSGTFFGKNILGGSCLQ